MTQIGMSQTAIDEIELRLLGADHRPWVLDRNFYDINGRPLICKGSNKAHRKAEWASLAWDKGDSKHQGLAGEGKGPDAVDRASYIKQVALFQLCDASSEDMGQFVANAPADIEALLAEVKRLRARYRDTEQERDEFKKEMLALRVEKASLQEKLTETRRRIRDFAALLKEAP